MITEVPYAAFVGKVIRCPHFKVVFLEAKGRGVFISGSYGLMAPLKYCSPISSGAYKTDRFSPKLSKST